MVLRREPIDTQTNKLQLPSTLFQGFILLVLLQLFGCSGNFRQDIAPESAVVEHEFPVDATQIAASSPSAYRSSPTVYRLRTGNLIDVKFYYAPELNESLIIRPDGKISLQLVGDLQAAGFTPSELRSRISAAFTGVLKQPEVAVIVKEYSPNQIFVDGEVRAPGELSYEGNLTALQAIIKAGGFSRDAETRSVVIVRAPTGKNAKLIRLNFNASCAFQLPSVDTRHDSELDLPGRYKMQGEDHDEDKTCILDTQGYPRPESVLVQPFDVVYVPTTRIASTAHFFAEYIGNILPIYRNFGFSFIYEITSDD